MKFLFCGNFHIPEWFVAEGSVLGKIVHFSPNDRQR
jgi:hypothetical protein